MVSLGLQASPVLASYTPNFPACPNPGGNLTAQYNSGLHGIPGDSQEYVGSDSVFQINSTQWVQCFCPQNGAGIQTNWLLLQDPSESEISAYKNQGWVFIPDGSAWGLQAASYVAQNSSISCVGGTGNGNDSSANTNSSNTSVCDSIKPGTPVLTSIKRIGSTATLSWNPVQNATHYSISYGVESGKYLYGVPNTGNVTQFTIGSLDPNKTYYWEVRAVNNCMPSDASSQPSAARGGGDILGSSTGFAPTGDWSILILAAGIGCILTGLSVAMRNGHESKK